MRGALEQNRGDENLPVPSLFPYSVLQWRARVLIARAHTHKGSHVITASVCVRASCVGGGAHRMSVSSFCNSLPRKADFLSDAFKQADVGRELPCVASEGMHLSYQICCLLFHFASRVKSNQFYWSMKQ